MADTLFETVDTLLDVDVMGRSKSDPDYDPFQSENEHVPGTRAAKEDDEFGVVRGADHALKNSDKKKKQPSHMGRAQDLLQEMHPGSMLYICEKKVTTYSGMVVKVDMWGFGDLCGITGKGAWVMANVTTVAAMAAHMRDYTDPTNVHGAGGLRVVDLLEKYLSLRGKFYIIGFEQEKPGARWTPTVWDVDQALIDQYKARKRK